ncbi:MAG: hypothetical protein CL846_04020 [Crocinitomicaceae bacterium]|nr:hypothetical protein [Crocinitomicaceae bacterium]
MIRYNPKEWFGLIVEFHKSDTLRRLIYVLIIYCGFSFGMVYLELHYTNFESTITIHSLVGFIIGLLLVFRTNTSYERWWEGRKLIGALVNTTRNLALKINAIVDDKDIEKREFYSKMISNYSFAFKEHLRDNRKIDELQTDINFDKKELEKIDHVPNYIAGKIFKENKKLYDEKLISGNLFITIDKQTLLLTDIIGGCERIKKTPIPYSYNIFIKTFIFIYTITLPIGLATTFLYWTVPISAFILYILASLELLAEEIENPFGTDQNDLPVEDICNTIKKNVEEILVN